MQRDSSVDLKGIFIEKKFAGELRDNLSQYGNRCVVLEGDYEERLKYFLTMQTEKQRNYFIYVDPYGIKSLSFSYLVGIKSLGFNSTEVLMNFNTTGFLREGCRLLKLTREAPDWAKDLDYDVDGRNTATHMDEVAGGIYWREILQNFDAGKIDFNLAEVCFTKSYVDVMRSVFQYVVDIPIKERSHHMPKYRLIFAGDHIDGLILMVDSMNKAWQILRRKERGGQLYLFDDNELAAIEHHPAQDLVWDKLCNPCELKQLLADLIMKHGITYTGKEYIDAIRENEGKMFTVERTPPLTPTGRKAISMNYKDYDILVGRKSKQENLF